MATWLYQINQANWTPQRYRVEVWEGSEWNWPVAKRMPAGVDPAAGDIVAFFYAPSGGFDAGFYGWAVIREWLERDRSIYFRPAAPSDHLKMNPWWDDFAKDLADRVRGKVKQGTLWLLNDDQERELRVGVSAWIACVGNE